MAINSQKFLNTLLTCFSALIYRSSIKIVRINLKWNKLQFIKTFGLYYGHVGSFQTPTDHINTCAPDQIQCAVLNFFSYGIQSGFMYFGYHIKSVVTSNGNGFGILHKSYRIVGRMYRFYFKT